ncbi:protein FAR1-RELATED SEQUENCE 5-like [Nicotiana tabacum]|uniref:Protein FAR1-RELATED SEQUENCE 5-like n=1 Tax=Nicotiana tabacum TaxID=4097 RepID=A0AC58SG08_TOBAC
MVNAGIKPTTTYSYLVEEADGANILGYSKKDYCNFIHQLMKSKVEAGDAQSVVNEFNHRQARGIAPQTIIIDQARGMEISIREVMSGTRHRLCQWHISQNALSHLSSLKNDKGFCKLFNKCMSECDSVTEFEQIWEMMLTTYNVEEHEWLNNLYNIRKMWSTTFNNDVFSA